MSYVLSSVRMAGELRKRPTPGPYSRPIGQDQSPDVGGGGGTAFLRGQVSGDNAGTTAAITLTLPGTTQVGDTVVLIQKNDWYTLAALATPTGTAVTGGTWVEKTDARYDGGSNVNHTKVWVGTVTTGGASTVISNWASPSGGDEERYAQAFVFIGAAPYDVGSTVAAASGTSWTAPSVTASTAGSYLLVSVGTDGTAGATNFTFPGSMTALTESDVSNTASYRSAYELLSSAGATGTRTVTLSNSHVGDITSLVVAPAATTTTYQGATNLTVGSTLTTDGTLEAAGAVDLSASASLISTPTPIAGAVTLTTAQSLTANSIRVVAGAVSLSATATLVSDGTGSGGGSTSLVITGVLGVGAQLTAFGAVALTTSQSLLLTPLLGGFGVASLSALPSLTVSSIRITSASVTLSVSGALSVSASQVMVASVGMVATGVLSVTAGSVIGNVSLVVGKTLSVAGTLQAFGAVSLSTVYSLSVSGARTTFGSVTLSAVPVLTVGVSVGITNGSVSLAALGTLSVNGIRVLNVTVGGVPLVAVGLLNVNGSTGSGGGTNLSATSTLLVSGVRVLFGAAQLNALPVISLGGITLGFATLVLNVNGVLVVAGVASRIGAVALVASSTITTQLFGIVVGAVALPIGVSLLFIDLFPEIDFGSIGGWSVGIGIHVDSRPYPRTRLSPSWTTVGTHVGSVH